MKSADIGKHINKQVVCILDSHTPAFLAKIVGSHNIATVFCAAIEYTTRKQKTETIFVDPKSIHLFEQPENFIDKK